MTPRILDAAVAVEAFEEYPSATAPFAPVKTRSQVVEALKPQATEIEAFVPAIEPQKAVGGQKGYVNDFIKKTLLVGIGLAALTAAVYYGERYWTVGRFEVSTDDAYVKADNTTIAPKVAGYIARVLVDDNEKVKAGQVLARIDDRDFKVAVEQANAEVAAAKAAIADKQAALGAQQSTIDAARAMSRPTRPMQPSPLRRTSVIPIWPRPASAVCRTPSRPIRAGSPRRPR